MGTEKVSTKTLPGKTPQALDFKSATLYAIRVVLHSAQTAELLESLARRMNDAGAFFENEPVVIDASRIEGIVDWPTLLDALRSHRLHPVGVVAEGEQQAAATAAGLPAVDVGTAPVRPTSAPVPDHDVPAAAVTPEKPANDTAGTHSSPTPTVTTAPDVNALDGNTAGSSSSPEASRSSETSAADRATAPISRPPEPAPAAMVINRPLRSGQRVYARNTDLIVIGVVSRGAEVIADGNIHVYGPLRGKAMAGARGDTSARIFTTQLDPELVAVAGVYRVIETGLDAGVQNKPAIVSLSGESLQIESLRN